MDTGIAVSTKTIQRWLSLEIGLKSYRPAGKPRLTKTLKKKHVWTLPKNMLAGTKRSGKGYFFLMSLL